MAPCVPVQIDRLRVFAVKKLAQAAVGHVLVNQKVGLVVGAASQEAHYIAVPDFAERFDLG